MQQVTAVVTEYRLQSTTQRVVIVNQKSYSQLCSNKKPTSKTIYYQHTVMLRVYTELSLH